MLHHLIFGGLLAMALVLGFIIGRWDQLPIVKRLQADRRLLIAQRDAHIRHYRHAVASLARREDEVDLLETRLAEAQAELVILRSNNDPEVA